MKFLDVMWFCAGHGNCAIVKILDEYEGVRYYIGAFPGEAKGNNEQEDIDHVIHWGSSFPKSAGDVLFGTDPLRDGSSVQIPMNREQAEAMVKVGMMYLEGLAK